LDKDNFRFLNYEKLKRIVDNAYDEIFVYDDNYNVVYVNKACERHYGQFQSELIGSDFHDLLTEETWYPSVLPSVYEEKRQLTIEQTSFLGKKLTTTAVPLFNENNEIEYVVMSVYDASCDLINQRLNVESQLGKNKDESKDNNLKEVVSDRNNKIYASSENMKAILEFSENIAKFDSTVLINGESGTGKTLLARYIHDNSIRFDGSFISINCAAIPENLLESELFGYVSGAFTGASKGGKKGLIELAAGGTILLDEIAELSLPLQAKLLHVIQDKEYLPIGGNKAKQADIRIIAATNKDLLRQVEKKLFREDLFWRLNVVEIEILPLRSRKEDVVNLTNRFLSKFNEKYNCGKNISNECVEFFKKYEWPGNIRQLENLIERLVITTAKETIEVNDLPKLMFKESKKIEVQDVEEFNGSFEYAVEQFEKNIVVKAYENNNSTRKLADVLKISQTKAARLIRKYCD
jgi:PAS domain S-box-containing protein